MSSLSGYLIGSCDDDRTPLPLDAELAWWYPFYFAIEQGQDRFAMFRHDFAKLSRHLALPRWISTTTRSHAVPLFNPGTVACTQVRLNVLHVDLSRSTPELGRTAK